MNASSGTVLEQVGYHFGDPPVVSDHAGGLRADAEGKALFPNATVWRKPQECRLLA